MSWVAVAVGGAAVVGAAGGAVASNNAAKKSASAVKGASADANQLQWDMYDQTREDFAPFRQPSDRALATLQSALYGGDSEYVDPRFTRLDSGELQNLNADLLRQSGVDYFTGKDNNFLLQHLANNPWDAKYSADKPFYRGPNGEITDKPTMLSAQWKPQESEGFKYTKSRTLEDLGRSLRMMGRGSGNVAANATGRTLGDLNVQNEATQRNELWNMVKTGQGAAGSIAGAGQNAANTVGGNIMSAGNNLASIAQNNGQTQANLWAGLGGTAANAYGAYQMGQYLNKPAAAPTYASGQGMPLWRAQ